MEQPVEQATFSPKVENSPDKIGTGLLKVAQTILFVMMGILPLFFIPGTASFLGGVKSFYVLLGLVVVVIIASLATLRNGVVVLRVSPLVLSWWAIVLAAAVSALLSPQLKAAFLGDVLEIHTVGFLLIMAVLMTAMYLLKSSGKSVVYLYLMLLGSAVFLSIFHVLRLFIDAPWLALGFLNSTSATFVGSFNDLALYMVMTVLIAMIALVQLHLPKAATIVLSTMVLLALLLLSVISFYGVWGILSIFSLLLLMYTLTRGRFGDQTKRVTMPAPSLISTLVITTVFVVSTVFLVGGSTLGGAVSRATGISYIEVRPSATATLDLLREVYKDNALTGAGPNHFQEVWLAHKDRAINETIFWNTSFGAGNGYIPTWFVTAGLLGVLTWLIFLGLFIWTGAQTLLRPKVDDAFWYFIATISFVSGLFVWGMSVFYVPGAAILLLGAMSTGLLVVAHQMLVPKQYPTVNLLTSARTGFVLIAVVMVVIIASILVGYQTVRQYMAAYTYVSTVGKATDINGLTAGVVKAFQFYQSDLYARDLATYQLGLMNQLVAVTSPGATEQQQFEQATRAALEASNEAVRLRPNDARNHRVQGDIYSMLAGVNVEGAAARALESYKKAAELDPSNPYYALQRAILAGRANNIEEARKEIDQALLLKSNYTDALIVLTQLDIASGDVEKAINTTRALLSLEPNNPGRYYQLGALLGAAKKHEEAISAFSAAIQLNPQYANARYMLAVEYFTLGRKEDALRELRTVRDMNPDNAGLDGVIGQIERGEVTPEMLQTGNANNNNAPISEPDGVKTEEEVTTTEEVPETDLLTPVNAIDKQSSSTKEVTEE